MIKPFASTSNSLYLLQIVAFSTVLIALFTASFSWTYLFLAVIFFYCYSILGISMMLHRFYTHKNFKLHAYVKWFFTIFAVLAGRGSPIGWVYVHRIHHATSDTEKDPHSPQYNKFNLVNFKHVLKDEGKINYFIVKDLITPAHKKIDEYYILLTILFVIMLFLIDYNLVFYVWAIPVFLVNISQNAFIYFGHVTGYRNFDTKDHSKNNFYLWPFILGDSWHNNHHYEPSNATTKVRWFEFDPIFYIIRTIKTGN